MPTPARMLRKLEPRTLRSKVAILFTLVVGTISIFFFLLIPARLDDQAMTALIEKAENVAKVAAFSVTSALVFEDSLAIRQMLQAGFEVRDLQYIVVTDQAGEIRVVVGADQILEGAAHAVGDASRGTFTPPSPCTGSTTNAAVSASIASRAASRSSKGTTGWGRSRASYASRCFGCPITWSVPSVRP